MRTGIDGRFGTGTQAAVKALQFDLLHNRGEGRDGASPVRVCDYNRSRVAEVDGVFNQSLAATILDMLADEQFPKVPDTADPATENARVVRQLEAMRSTEVPAPFLIAVLKQESGLKHYCEPTPRNDDNFVVVGMDRNLAGTPAITSRGYGVGQHTLFHHPPQLTEVKAFILDPVANVRQAAGELRKKFDHFVDGGTPAARAEERQTEIGQGPLRNCRHAQGDPRYMTGCRNCLLAAGAGPVRCAPTRIHPAAEYAGAPIRKNIGCDWPYVVRRYNGSGPNSYHYQAQVLLRILNG